eukprot:11213612-Lingulodinium_polyedra.AAC.1
MLAACVLQLHRLRLRLLLPRPGPVIQCAGGAGLPARGLLRADDTVTRCVRGSRLQRCVRGNEVFSWT